MLDRRHLFGAAIGAALLPAAAVAQSAPGAFARMMELGRENEASSRRVGLWDVTETSWERPGADPIVSTGLVAERRMIGPLLQEMLRPANDPSGNDIRRIDYLTFNRVEGRWDYVSMDLRDPDGIMSAWSFTPGDGTRIDFTFQPFAVAGDGPDVAGRMLRLTQVITRDSPDHDIKDQLPVMADGTGTMWLAHRYAYARKV